MHSDYDWLHELKRSKLRQGISRNFRPCLACFSTLVFTLHDDVVSFDRVDFVHPWQHTSIVEVMVLHNGEEVLF